MNHPNSSIDGGLLAICKTACSSLHNDPDLEPMRLVSIGSDGTQTIETAGCYGFLTHHGTRTAPSATLAYCFPFQGDGCAYSFQGLTNADQKQQETIKGRRDKFKFVGTERSLIWVNYLLSNKSPWKALLPYMLLTDAEFINNSGFMFHSPKDLPSKLLYNFLMAIRFPWEMEEAYSTWLILREQMDDTLALFIASNFELQRGAESLDGPWELYYPYSFLEQCSLDAANNFISQTPNTLLADCKFTPNVRELWSVSLTTNPMGISFTKHIESILSQDKTLSLKTIEESIARCVGQQQLFS